MPPARPPPFCFPPYAEVDKNQREDGCDDTAYHADHYLAIPRPPWPQALDRSDGDGGAGEEHAAEVPEVRAREPQRGGGDLTARVRLEAVVRQLRGELAFGGVLGERYQPDRRDCQGSTDPDVFYNAFERHPFRRFVSLGTRLLAGRCRCRDGVKGGQRPES